MDERLVTIRSYSLPWQADLARTALEAAGIPAFVADSNTIRMNWLFSNLIGGVKLQVPESYAKAANEMLSTNEQALPDYSEEDNDSHPCPECGKRNWTFIRRGHQWGYLSLLLFGIPLLISSKRCQCLECGTIWKDK